MARKTTKGKSRKTRAPKKTARKKVGRTPSAKRKTPKAAKTTPRQPASAARETVASPKAMDLLRAWSSSRYSTR